MNSSLKINFDKLTFKSFLRGFFVIGFFVLILIGIVAQERPFKLRMREADIALKSIYAPYDFSYNGAADEAETQKERQKARNAVREIYSLDPQLLSDALVKAENFFKQISFAKDELGHAQAEKERDNIRQRLKIKLEEGLGITLSESSIMAFLKTQEADAKQASGQAQNLLHSVYSRGILSKPDKTRLQGAGEKEFTIFDTTSHAESSVEAEKAPTNTEAGGELYSRLKTDLSDKKLALAVSELLQNLITPNLVFENELTESKRQSAAGAVPVQYRRVEVKKGQLITGKGERVSKEHIAQLASIEKSESYAGRLKFLAGVILLISLLLFILAVYLVLYEPKIFHSTSSLALIGILSAGIIFIARAIIVSPLPSYLIPVASASMLLAILLNPRLAVFMAICWSIAVSINIDNSLNLVVTFLFGGLAGIFYVRNIRRRWHIMMAGILVGITNCAAIIAIGLLNNLNFDSFMTDSAWGFANGIICAFIVTGILPLLEDMFNIATNITLLELSDTNHPLLKQMIFKAPGTYHHSMMVGNLAEAASEAIGANSLLARVGSYYHDVGKIEKAEYFSENQTKAGSIHDKLTPSMSRLVITNHVKDGLEFAKKYKLRKAILDFIEQHHGTGLVYYFFHKALERVEDESMLKEEGFRYPGPKPQTKETAIVLLADSVEAASRAMANPTPSRIEELTHRIINNKFIDGQLDECELTLKDLNKIAEVFKRILMGVFHSRVEYPQDKNFNGAH